MLDLNNRIYHEALPRSDEIKIELCENFAKSLTLSQNQKYLKNHSKVLIRISFHFKYTPVFIMHI